MSAAQDACAARAASRTRPGPDIRELVMDARNDRYINHFGTPGPTPGRPAPGYRAGAPPAPPRARRQDPDARVRQRAQIG
jgi:hypothetical protein